MNESSAVNILNAMNGYILASEELAVLLACGTGDNDERIEIAQKQMQHSFVNFKNAFHNATDLVPVFHPSQATVQPGIVYPHGRGEWGDKIVWSDPYWTVEH